MDEVNIKLSFFKGETSVENMEKIFERLVKAYKNGSHVGKFGYHSVINSEDDYEVCFGMKVEHDVKEINETISTSTYFLMREEPIAHNSKTNEDVMGWVMMPNSERSYPYPDEELKGKKNWKQFKRTITEEEVI